MKMSVFLGTFYISVGRAKRPHLKEVLGFLQQVFELCQLKEVLLQCLLVLVGFQQLSFKFLQHRLFRVQAHPEKL